MVMETNLPLDSLRAQARAASSAGDAAAPALWMQVERSAEDDAEAPLALARLHLKQGQAAEAIACFLRAESRAPQEAVIPLERAGAHKLAGDVQGEIAARRVQGRRHRLQEDLPSRANPSALSASAGDPVFR